jgi:hypothetical protein
MRENQKPWTIIRIGIGIMLILSGIIAFTRATSYELATQNLFLGTGLLFYALADNQVEPDKKKIFTYIGAVSLIIGSVLVLYHTVFSSK